MKSYFNLLEYEMIKLSFLGKRIMQGVLQESEIHSAKD